MSQTSLLQVEPRPPASHAGPTHKNNIFYLELISDWYLQANISQLKHVTQVNNKNHVFKGRTQSSLRE